MAIEVLDKGMCVAMGRVEWDEPGDEGQTGRLYALGVSAIEADGGNTALVLDHPLGKVGGSFSRPTVLLTAFDPNDIPPNVIMSGALGSGDGINYDRIVVSAYDPLLEQNKLRPFDFAIFVRDFALVDTLIVPP